jgi:hypothetical protein
MVVVASAFSIPVIAYGWLVLALLPLWIWIAWQMRKEYKRHEIDMKL